MFAIILFAMVAVLVALRLYSVLGRRTGSEQPIVKAAEAVPVLVPAVSTPRGDTVREPAGDGELIGSGAAAGIRQIVQLEPGFDVVRFVGGARQAYGMVLDAFWKGDEQEVGRFADDEVQRAFAAAIARRNTDGHKVDNRLVAIETAQIERARVEGKIAFITVRFDADVAAITRDAEGAVVGGSLTDAIQTHDLWTFSRTLKSGDPNWILVETDEA